MQTIWLLRRHRFVLNTTPGVLTLNEAEVVQLARRGDAESFGLLLREAHDDMRGLVWSVLRNPEQTDDVLQAAYEKAFLQIGDFQGSSAFKTWLHSICYRTALDHIRYERRRRHEDLDAIRDLASQTDVAEDAESRMQMTKLLEKLDGSDRGLLFLRGALSCTYDEMVEITGLPRGTIAARMSRLKRRLKEEQI